SLAADGALALRTVVVPAGQFVTVAGQGATAFYVLHMANQGAGSTGPLPTPQGPGRWVRKKFAGSDEARRYQEQVTGRPAADLYYIGDVEFDGFAKGELLEAKGPNYKNFFDRTGEPKPWFVESGGFDGLINQAKQQSIQAKKAGLSLEWHVADAEVVGFLKRHFHDAGIDGIHIIHTPPLL
ncbi:Tox-REase-5 domain-containing protein, partial [Pyxidicoccus sp. 3LG]